MSGSHDEVFANGGIPSDPDESAQLCGDAVDCAEIVEHQQVGSGSVADGGKEPSGEPARRIGIDAQPPAPAGSVPGEHRAASGCGVSHRCAESPRSRSESWCPSGPAASPRAIERPPRPRTGEPCDPPSGQWSDDGASLSASARPRHAHSTQHLVQWEFNLGVCQDHREFGPAPGRTRSGPSLMGALSSMSRLFLGGRFQKVLDSFSERPRSAS